MGVMGVRPPMMLMRILMWMRKLMRMLVAAAVVKTPAVLGSASNLYLCLDYCDQFISFSHTFTVDFVDMIMVLGHSKAYLRQRNLHRKRGSISRPLGKHHVTNQNWTLFPDQ
jgi:hypothetical protein